MAEQDWHFATMLVDTLKQLSWHQIIDLVFSKDCVVVGYQVDKPAASALSIPEIGILTVELMGYFEGKNKEIIIRGFAREEMLLVDFYFAKSTSVFFLYKVVV